LEPPTHLEQGISLFNFYRKRLKVDGKIKCQQNA
jgi:hypothetical protein